MSIVTLIVPRQVVWTDKLQDHFITQAGVSGPPRPWGYLRYLGEGMWKLLTIFHLRKFYSFKGESHDANLNEVSSCILLTDRATAHTAEMILRDAGHHVEIVRYDGLLQSS
jgi:hypothetical protein